MKRISSLLFAALILLAQGHATAQTERKPLVLNVILPLTGFGAFIGTDEQNAFRAFEERVNKSGGLRGVPIHFQVYDDQSQPAVAVQLLGQVLAQHPAVVFGSGLASPTLAMAALVDKSGPVLYATNNNLEPAKGGYVYAAGLDTADAYLAMLAYYKARHLITFALLATADASGDNSITNLRKALKMPAGNGCTIVDTERFAPNDMSVAAQAAKIKASGAQVIVTMATGTAFGTSLHGLADAGLLGVPVYTSAGNFTPSFLRGLQSVLPDELDSGGPSFLKRDRPKRDPLGAPIERFYAALADVGVTMPNVAHAYAWDPALVVFAALEKTGPNATPDQLRAAIETLKRFPGVSGPYDFTGGDRHGLHVDSVLMFKNDKSNPGRLIIVSRQGGEPL